MDSKHSTKPGQNRWGSLYVMASVMGRAVASGWISPEVAGGQWKAIVVYRNQSLSLYKTVLKS